ncbi:MAG: PQQ-binding-like beta-propeller repeat protein [Fuerstiella sp.]
MFDTFRSAGFSSQFAVAVLIVLLPCAAGVGVAEDWPWFLGPRHDGTSNEQGLNLDWKKSPVPVLWKKRVGTGYSAPSLVGQQLIFHDLSGRDERVSSLRVSDGEVVWEKTYPCDYKDPYGYNNGPRCSPLIVKDRCFSLGPNGALSCLNRADGEIVWKRNLQDDFDLPDWFFGVGCTPVFHDNMLIVLVGGQPNSGVVAFDATSGSVLWQHVGRETWQGAETSVAGKKYRWTGDEMVASYSSPIVATIHGQQHLLCLMRQGLVSLNPRTGEEYFHYWFRAKVHESVNAARPVVIGNQVFLSAAYRLGATLLDVQPDGRGVTTVWENDTLQAHWSTPIHVDGFLYGFSGRHENEGELRCVRVSDGKLMWKTTGFEGDRRSLVRQPGSQQLLDKATMKPVPYPYFGRGSLTRVGEHFVVLGERGTLAVSKIDSLGYAELHRISFPEISYPAWTAPVISNGKLYLRSEDWLLCVDLNSPSNASGTP